MKLVRKWRKRGPQLKREVVALYLAFRDPRVPWYAKAVAVCVVGYALSPIDLIPDPIPILGYLDDLIIVPLGIALAVRLIPPDILEDCRQRADEKLVQAKRAALIAAGVIVLLWIIMIVAIVVIVRHTL